jgi:hypothetical protein
MAESLFWTDLSTVPLTAGLFCVFQVINLTADLLTEARAAVAAAPPVPAALPSQALNAALSVGIRKPEPRVVLKKTPEGRLPIGSKVEALYREDGEW